MLPHSWIFLGYTAYRSSKRYTGLINNVLLVKIEGPVWYTIYNHLPVVKGVSSNPSINQPFNGKRTSMGLILSSKSSVPRVQVHKTGLLTARALIHPKIMGWVSKNQQKTRALPRQI